MRSPQAVDLWRILDRCFESEGWSAQWALIQQVASADANHLALATGAKRLFDLQAPNSKDQGHRKAIGYATLAGILYFRLKRVGPAMALMDAIKPWPESLEALKSLDQAAGELLSKESPSKSTFKSSEQIQSAIPAELKASANIEGPQRPVALFSQLAATEVRAVLNQATLKNFSSGESVFEAGDEAFAFYIIAEGTVEILDKGQVHRTLDEGDFFGELGLLTGGKRTFSLRAKGKLKLLEFSREKLFGLMGTYPALEQRLYQFFCWRLFAYMAKQNPFISQMTEDQLAQFFYLCSVERSKRGQVLMKAGQKSEFFLYLLMGEVDVSREGQSFGPLGAGSVVGEIGVLTGQARSAQVVAKSEVTFLRCGKVAFDHLKKYFPDFETWLQKVAAHRMQAELTGLVD